MHILSVAALVLAAMAIGVFLSAIVVHLILAALSRRQRPPAGGPSA